MEVVASPSVYAQEALRRDIERLREKEQMITKQQMECLERNSKRGVNNLSPAPIQGTWQKSKSAMDGPSTSYIHYRPGRVIRYEDLYDDPGSILQNVTRSKMDGTGSIKFIGSTIGSFNEGTRGINSLHGDDVDSFDNIQDDLCDNNKEILSNKEEGLRRGDIMDDRDYSRNNRKQKIVEEERRDGYEDNNYYHDDGKVNKIKDGRGRMEKYGSVNDNISNQKSSSERDRILASIIEGKTRFSECSKEKGNRKEIVEEDLDEWYRTHLTTSRQFGNDHISKTVSNLEKRVSNLETGMKQLENTMSYLAESQQETKTNVLKGSGDLTSGIKDSNIRNDVQNKEDKSFGRSKRNFDIEDIREDNINDNNSNRRNQGENRGKDKEREAYNGALNNSHGDKKEGCTSKKICFKDIDEMEEENNYPMGNNSVSSHIPESVYAGEDTYVSAALNGSISGRTHAFQSPSISKKLSRLRARDDTYIYRVTKVSVSDGDYEEGLKTLWIIKNQVVTGDPTDTKTGTGAFCITHIEERHSGSRGLDEMVKALVESKRESGTEFSEEEAREILNEERYPNFVFIRTKKHTFGFNFDPEDFDIFISAIEKVE